MDGLILTPSGARMTNAQQRISFILGALALVGWLGTGLTATFQVWKHWDFLSTTVTPEAASRLEYRLQAIEMRLDTLEK